MLCLIEAVNLIEFFGAAALFGWLTYTVGIDDLLKRVNDAEKMKAAKAKIAEPKLTQRETLDAINDYFILSFILYGASIIADYFKWHPTVLGAGAVYGFAGLTALAFALGTIVLMCPVAYLFCLIHGRQVFVQGVGAASAFFLMTVVDILTLALMLPRDPVGRTALLFPGIVAFVGLGYGMLGKFNIRRLALFLFAELLSWATLAILVILGITHPVLSYPW